MLSVGVEVVSSFGLRLTLVLVLALASRTCPAKAAEPADEVRRPKPVPRVDFDGPQEFTFEPLAIRTAIPEGASKRAQSTAASGLTDVDGCLPLSNGLDALWVAGDLYLASERGAAQLVYSEVKLNRRVHEVCYDGALLWFTIRSFTDGPPALICLDPKTLQWESIGHEHGLPIIDSPMVSIGDEQYPQTLVVAALAPGKVCVAGTMGPSWIAVVSRRKRAPPKVEVFHEAKVTLTLKESHELGGWRRSDLAFIPLWMQTLTDAAAKPPQVKCILARQLFGSQGDDVERHPLIVDPAQKSVGVFEDLQDNINHQHRSFDALGPAIYQVGIVRPAGFVGLQLYALPDLRRQVLLDDVPNGAVRILNGTIYIVGQQVWKMGFDDKAPQLCAARLPWQFSRRSEQHSGSKYPPIPQQSTKDDYDFLDVFHSAHFGLLVKTHHGRGQNVTFAATGLSVKKDPQRGKPKRTKKR